MMVCLGFCFSPSRTENGDKIGFTKMTAYIYLRQIEIDSWILIEAIHKTYVSGGLSNCVSYFFTSSGVPLEMRLQLLSL